MPPFALWACSHRQFAYVLTPLQDRPASSIHSSSHDDSTISRFHHRLQKTCYAAHTRRTCLHCFVCSAVRPTQTSNSNTNVLRLLPSSGLNPLVTNRDNFFLLSSQPPLPVPPSPTRPPIPCNMSIKNPQQHRIKSLQCSDKPTWGEQSKLDDFYKTRWGRPR